MPGADADDLKLLEDAAAEAAALALGYFRRDPRVWHKANASPVSEADLAVDRLLRERLTGSRSGYGWLSEETEDDPARLDTARLFVVDPIDGTRGFLAGSDEWTVSLAVVEAGRPVAAALVQPVGGHVWTATAGGGAFLDGRRLAVKPATPGAGLRVAGPSTFFAALAPAGPLAGRAYVASLALRVAMVADGRLDVALAKPNAHDWDIAAADLILAEAGGSLVDTEGRPCRYNRPEPRHGALLACAEAAVPRLSPLVAAAAGG